MKEKQEETMKYLLGMVCALSVMSCVTTPTIDRYAVSVTDTQEGKIAVQSLNLYGGPDGIIITVINSAGKPVKLLLSESMIGHNDIEDGIFIPADPNSIGLRPSDVTLDPGQIYKMSLYPKSLSEMQGYYNGKPQIWHKIIHGIFSLVLYYRYEDEEK
jgi:hypothetical protein